MEKKKTGRDYPLSATPNFVTNDTISYMSRNEYKNKMRDAKRRHNIKAAEEGTLNEERTKKIKNVINVVGDAVKTASAAKNLVTGSGTPSFTPPPGGYKRK